MSDNVIHFTPGKPVKLQELNKQVLIIRKDGVLIRPPSMKPVSDLPREELLKVIDELVDVIRRGTR